MEAILETHIIHGWPSIQVGQWQQATVTAGVVLFKIDAAVHFGYTSACTDKPCAWTMCTDSRIADIRFYTDAAKARSSTAKVKVIESATETEQQQLMSCRPGRYQGCLAQLLGTVC